MPKKKLQRFADLSSMPHVLQEPGTLPCNWQQEFFHNPHPITLELGCGNGEYTIALAQKHPQRNFIGVDLKGSRLWNGAKRAQLNQLPNVAFLRIFIEKLGEFFGPAEVDELWITFPDPYPVYSKRNKRLTSARFLDIYRKILKPDGIIHLKTDNDTLYRYTQVTLAEQGGTILARSDDIDASPVKDERWLIRTKYELKYRSQGRKIKYLCFRI